MDLLSSSRNRYNYEECFEPLPPKNKRERVLASEIGNLCTFLMRCLAVDYNIERRRIGYAEETVFRKLYDDMRRLRPCDLEGAVWPAEIQRLREDVISLVQQPAHAITVSLKYILEAVFRYFDNGGWKCYSEDATGTAEAVLMTYGIYGLATKFMVDRRVLWRVADCFVCMWLGEYLAAVQVEEAAWFEHISYSRGDKVCGIKVGSFILSNRGRWFAVGPSH